MEDVSLHWSHPTFQQIAPPSLQELLFYYEHGAKGASGVTSDTILHEILPAWQKPIEGEPIEDLFAEIRGDTPLVFKDFAIWMRRYFQAVHKMQKEAEAEE